MVSTSRMAKLVNDIMNMKYIEDIKFPRVDMNFIFECPSAHIEFNTRR